MHYFQSVARQLDEWDTDGIFRTKTSRYTSWLTLGLSQSIPATPTDVYMNCSPQSYNRMARIFWGHMLFDLIAYHAGFRKNQPHSVPVKKPELNKLLQREGVKPVRIQKPIQKRFAGSSFRRRSSSLS